VKSPLSAAKVFLCFVILLFPAAAVESRKGRAQKEGEDEEKKSYFNEGIGD